ncbi:MAG: FkbM family methyltransferase [Desulfurococcaceae archaeon]
MIICYEYNSKIKLFKKVSKFATFLKVSFIKFAVSFANRRLVFIIPVAIVEKALDNLSHVLVDCDYFHVKKLTPSDGHLIIDGGAFLGYYTVASSALSNNKALVISFEPNTEIVPVLSMNVELNKARIAKIYPYALCPQSGSTNLYVGAYPAVSSVIREHVENYTSVEKTIEVRCVKLSSLLSFLSYVDLLKLDIEGLELDVIREAGRELTRVGGMVVEIHKDIVEPYEVENIVREHGFDVAVLYTSSEMDDQAILYAYRSRTPGYLLWR